MPGFIIFAVLRNRQKILMIILVAKNGAKPAVKFVKFIHSVVFAIGRSV